MIAQCLHRTRTRRTWEPSLYNSCATTYVELQGGCPAALQGKHSEHSRGGVPIGSIQTSAHQGVMSARIYGKRRHGRGLLGRPLLLLLSREKATTVPPRPAGTHTAERPAA